MGFVFTVGLFFLCLYGMVLALLWGLNRPWWQVPWVRRTALWTPLAGLLSGVLWRAGAHLELNLLVFAGLGVLAGLFLCLAGLLVALLLTGLVHAAEWTHDRWHHPQAPSPERRHLLRRGLVVVPALSTLTAGGGMIASATPARIPRIDLNFPELPTPLAGLKILQLSDIHIGPYIRLSHLEALLGRAADLGADLVLVTGDLCDDMPVYAQTLQLIEQLRPSLGVYACLGNHEHFRGLRRIKEHFAKSGIRLLVNEGVVLEGGSAALYLGGTDDPRHLRSPESYQLLRRYVERSLAGAPAGVFRVLMSHRAQALDYAAPLGVELVLAGHTHGFQLGHQGRSFFESWMPERYPWGLYRQGPTQLYTSAGVGHWFPFRLGCPPEAPLFTLRRANPLPA